MTERTITYGMRKLGLDQVFSLLLFMSWRNDKESLLPSFVAVNHTRQNQYALQLLQPGQKVALLRCTTPYAGKIRPLVEAHYI